MADVAGKMVGIDLGTTFSAIATLDNSANPVTLPNRDGEMLTPSAVLLDGDSIVIGQAALDVSLEHPDRVATLIKRRMGYASYGRLIDGREFRPETLSAILLRKLVQDAELRIGPVRKAVITVPAYFDDTRRKATKDAGRIAGLEVLDILDEPTAAALAYSFQPPRRAGTLLPDRILPDEQRTVLVYDLGGGTFDATLVRLRQGRFQTLAIEGDVRLGGKDWDDRIIDHVANQFLKEYGEDPRSDPKSFTLLAAAAERAKRTLSKLMQTTITCTHSGKVLSVPVTRGDFEASDLRSAGAHALHGAAGLAPGQLDLGWSGPHPAGGRLDAHADDRSDAARSDRPGTGRLVGGERGRGPGCRHPRGHRGGPEQ